MIKGHDSVSIRKSMEISQWWNESELEKLQLANLKNYLSTVYENVPYYKIIMDEKGILPSYFTSLSDLESFPFLTKNIITSNTDSIKSRKASNLIKFNTGGSTGTPLIFYVSKERISHDVAAKWRATRWWNVDIGDPELVIWGSPIELGSQDRIKNYRDRILRSYLLKAFEMSPLKIDEFINKIIKLKPKMLFGYPSSLALIAQHAKRKNNSLDNLGIKVAFVTSEKLYDDQRSIIEEVFGCPVANGYGGRDAGFIAHQCPDGGMHITSEDIIVELIDDDGNVVPDGEPGEVVVTHLATRDFPFIRYRTGDIAVKDINPCKCGRGLPLLREIQGRSTDFLVAEDGTIMHGLALIYILRDINGIESFKIIQESKQLTRIIIKKNEIYESSSEGKIVKESIERLGKNVSVLVEYVNTIPAEKSGKFRYVVSKV
ncbi:MAG: phenylacetate--CoA ligase family protein [Gammaproteobacteria bacterium]|nr:phenylacetate--CoA ligase family protein [Gammaproteobacteria bacterium]